MPFKAVTFQTMLKSKTSKLPYEKLSTIDMPLLDEQISLENGYVTRITKHWLSVELLAIISFFREINFKPEL